MVMTTSGLNVVRDWFASETNNAPQYLVIAEGGRLVDNFESYNTDPALQAVWSTNESTVTRDISTPKEGSVTCIWTTNSSPASDPTMDKTISSEDWSDFNRLEFWFKTSDASKPHYVTITNNSVAQTPYDFSSQLYNNTWIMVSIKFSDAGWDFDDVEDIKFSVGTSDFSGGATFYIDNINVFALSPLPSDTKLQEELTRISFEEVDSITSQEVTFKAFLPSTDAATKDHVLRRVGLSNTQTLNTITVFTNREHADILKTDAIDVEYIIQFRIQGVE
jgi:hypothetical protein